jgi:hypothetical protein
MAESPPPSSRARLDDDFPRSSRPLRLIDPSFAGPPSEPRPIAGRPGADAGPDRTNPVQGRVQLIAALLLLLVLVVVPLYLWRRPRATANEEKTNATQLTSAQVADTQQLPPDPKPHTKDGVTVTDAKVVGCHDTGSKRTAPAACDHLPGLEGALAKAVLDSASCVPPGTAGAITFHADASYARHKNPIRVKHGTQGTTLAPKVIAACVGDVRKALASIALDQAHAHARYEVEIDATYKR